MRRIQACLCAVVFLAGCKKAGGNGSAPSGAALQTRGKQSSTAAVPADEKAVLAQLTQAVRRFGMEQQRRPKDLGDLVASGYLPALPVPPAGKKYVIDRNLSVILIDQ